MTITVENIFNGASAESGKEDCLTLLENVGARIERIVSNTASSPDGFWYDQPDTEWVMIVRGEATLEFDCGGLVEMKEGDYLTIPPHARHRVCRTGPGTIWLAVHLKSKA